LYEKYNYLIPQYKDKTLYYGLQPLDIVFDLQTKYSTYLNNYIFSTVFTQNTMTGFRNKVQSILETKKQLQEKEIEKEMYNQVPMSVISYIENASKIRTILYNKLSYNKDSICKLIDEDIVPLSLFLALFFNNNYTNEQVKNNFNNQSAIMYLFEEKGINIQKIRNVLGISIDEGEVKNTAKNMYAIKELYRKYYSSGNDININPSKVSIQGIVKSILNRSFTSSLVIEKILSKFNCNVEMFKNIEQETTRALENRKKTEEQETIKNFYKDVPKKTRDFIEFAGKTYALILDKMSEKKHNDKILATNNDAAVLALYIASSFFNGKISTFFNNSGASYEKILKLLKISITKEEIESKPLERHILVEEYKKYVYEGENNGRSSNLISIDDICFNMCKRDFTKTMILENIYNSLVPEIEITNNFLPLMKEYFVKKEKQMKIEVAQKLFHDMPVETIKIVENASRIYPKLIERKRGLDKRGAQAVSILLSILYSDNDKVQDFLIKQGFNKHKVCEYFGVDSRYLLSRDIDIDLLANDYGLLIFGLNNKNTKREDLTPFSLIRNIFTKEFHNSNVELNKFLDEFNLSYDSLENLDTLYDKYEEIRKCEEIAQKVHDDMYNFPIATRNYIKNVLRIHEKLETIWNNNVNQSSDIELVALLLGVYTSNYLTKEILARNGITKDCVLSMFKLDDSFLDNLEEVEIDFNTYTRIYKKHLVIKDQPAYIETHDVFKNVFKDNMFIKKLSDWNGCNYERLKREIETGKKYEESLTIEDRINELNAIQVGELPQGDVQNILEFGNALIPHSEYIHDKLPEVVDNGVNGDIKTMTKIIDDMYVPVTGTEKKSNFFNRMFNNDDVRYQINQSKLHELENLINKKLQVLKCELLWYDSLRKYVEQYSKKNRECYQKAESAIQTINAKLESMDANDEEQYSDYLTTTSFLHIINDKANRFATVNLLMRKELLRLNQAIVNHFITINSLEMAKDDLLPLIESEVAISQGRNTENQALNLSKNVMGLFQALLTRNVDSAIENMNKLQNSCIPETVVNAINQDISTYLQGITQIKTLEEKIGKTEETGKILGKRNDKKD